MTTLQAIEAATRLAAEACGVSALVGTLEPGKEADLFVVGGNPLEDTDRSDHPVIEYGRRAGHDRDDRWSVPAPHHALLPCRSHDHLARVGKPGMDVIAWNGTSGGWRGLETDYALCEAITSRTGAQATTSTLALIEAFKTYDVRNYALAVPYLESITRAIISTYAGVGFNCTSCGCLGISVNSEFAYVPDATMRDLVRRSDHRDADAVAIICTNFPAAWLVEDMEAELGKPIFDSTIVTVWHALRLAGLVDSLAGWGRLLREQFTVRC